MSETWKLVPTANPEQWSFVVKVSTQDLRPEMQMKIDTPYKEVQIGERKRVNEGWGEYLYKETTPSQDDGFIELLFVAPPNKDANGDLVQPTPYRSTPSFESNVPWPPVLEELPNGKYIDFNEDNRIPFQAVGGTEDKYIPRTKITYNLRPAWQGLTLVITEEYLSSVPWTVDQLAVDQPSPQEVRFELFAQNAQDVRVIPPCLHGDIEMPALGGVTTYPYGGGDEGYRPAVDNPMTFLATNHEEWQPYRVRASQEYSNGVYRITIATAYPPNTDDLVEFTN